MPRATLLFLWTTSASVRGGIVPRPRPPCAFVPRPLPRPPPGRPLRSPLRAGDDDFWSEYEPTSWEAPPSSLPDEDPSDPSALLPAYDESRGHDYARDPFDDGAPVDAAAVDALLAERLSCKKLRKFDEADLIREELKRDFGVEVWDKDRRWATGGGTRSNNRRERRKKALGPRPEEFVERDFGPRGHDYERTGGETDPACDLSEEEIDAKLAERLQAKLARDFAASDAIQQYLWTRGIRINDGAKEWRADGESFGGAKRYARSEKSDDADAETEQQIQDLVQQRNDAKQGKFYDIADDLRATLKEDFAVVVDDKRKEWSVGGRFAPLPPKGYRLVGDKGGLSPDDVTKVQEAIDARLQCKKKRDYNTADLLRDELTKRYSVKLDDRAKEWRVLRPRSFSRPDDAEPYEEQQPDPDPEPEPEEVPPPSPTGDYVRSPASARLPRETRTVLSHVEAKLRQRSAAIRGLDYQTADRLRAELKDEFRIEIDDRARTWRAVDAADLTLGAPAPATEEAPSFDRPVRAGPRLSEEDEAYVAMRLDRMAEAQRDLDYDTVYAVRVELQTVYGAVFDEEGGSLSVDAEVAAESVADSAFARGTAGGKSALEEREFLQGLTIPVLKERCRDRGLRVGGRKAELIERIMEDKSA